MFHCSIHPQEKSVGYCKDCQKFYCESCAEKDRGFFYCPVHHRYMPSRPAAVLQEQQPIPQNIPSPSGFLISHFVKGAIDDPDQQKILNLPYENSHLVFGVPGSGKTLLAMLRAKLAPFDKNRVLLLVYNRPLKQLFAMANGDGAESYKVETFHSWFYAYYKEVAGTPPPFVTDFEYDWLKIYDVLSKKGIHKYYEYVVVDEAQDFPLELLNLLKYVSKRVTVFIDPNQNIVSEDDDKIVKLCGAMKLNVSEVYHLTKNYRSTPEIHRFSQNFFLGKYPKGSECFSTRRGRKVAIYRKFSWDETWDEVANYAEENPGHRIGVVLSSIRFGNKALEQLTERLPDKKVALYKWLRSYRSEPVDFFSDVVIMSLNTVKGLGFDAVFIVRVGYSQMQIHGTDELLGMNKFYVACTRAKRFLGVFCEADTQEIKQFFHKGEFDLVL
ncbi:MAG: AAA family ATPase [Candidatus Omnitrophica bacterium]|nr:AAA family ATPase [Candidatus Omnitrophota bacterium]